MKMISNESIAKIKRLIKVLNTLNKKPKNKNLLYNLKI